MFGTHFYHKKTRIAVAIFGKLFNNIYVLRTNSNNDVISQVKVPLSYAPKAKFLERIRSQPDLDTDQSVAIKLPRMSFEITAIAYDNARQLPKVSNFATVGTDNTNRQKFFSPVPYNINFQLNIYAKTQDDALQIVEQILPTFNPQYSLTIKPFSTEFPTFKEDVPIIIEGVGFQDDFEGEVAQRRTIIYNMEFQMKLNYYGNIGTSDIIRTSKARIFQPQVGVRDSDEQIELITVTPNPLNTIGLADSDFGFTDTIQLTFGDSA